MPRTTYVILLIGLLAAPASVAAPATQALPTRQTGRTFYVAPTGKDINPGSTDAPFATVQRAANLMKAGDTTLVRAGAYANGLVLGWDTPTVGTPNFPVTFTADPD